MADLLDIRDLAVEYRTYAGVAKALNGLNLSICSGETVGLVGESGAGKTTTALSVLRLLPARISTVKSGAIVFEGENLMEKSERFMQSLRGNRIAMVFQNPLTSLNPVLSVGEQISNVLMQHGKLHRREAMTKASGLLEMVGIPSNRRNEFPHQFSGGMRQRVGIAIALACKPSLLIADEPTTALDVTIQAQVLSLMLELRVQMRMALLLITHNLGIVAETCQRVAVIYAGRIVERGSAEDVFSNPLHPYTVGLLRSVPRIDEEKERLNPIEGAVVSALDLPRGCSFWPRCPASTDLCREVSPGEEEKRNGHIFACHHA